MVDMYIGREFLKNNFEISIKKCIKEPLFGPKFSISKIVS